MKIPIIITETSGIRRTSEPVTMGLPFPQGAVHDASQLALLNPAGEALPFQGAVSLRWADGSMKWGLFDFQADVEADGRSEYHLILGRQARPSSAIRGITVTTRGQDYVVDTGRFECLLSKAGGFTVTASAFDQDQCGWLLEDAKGARYEFRAERLEAETLAPLRTTFRVDGSFLNPQSGKWLECDLGMSFYANSAMIKLQVTLRNPRRAAHPENHWDLGDSGSAFIKDFSLKLTLKGQSSCEAIWSDEAQRPFQATQIADLEIYQDSSGGEHWKSLVHVNRDNRVMNAFRGYRIRSQEQVTRGERAQPIVALWDGRTGIAGSIRHFWQNCPKALEVSGRSIVFRLFPAQHGDVHELLGGEQKTHVLHVALMHNRTDAENMTWVRAPLIACSTPEWYSGTSAIPYLTPRSDDRNHEYLTLVDAAIDGDDTFENKREFIDEYGWRHFGDLYADHEKVYYQGEPPVVSHYNNQYDAINGAFLQYLRSGDLRWFEMMDNLALHVVDIDIYHTQEDRPAYNHGMFWHTNHYTHAFTSGHRAYTKKAGHGGGPSNEHCYTTGLLHHYLLTGNRLSRQVVVNTAQWIITTDDGTKTSLSWLDRGYTGYASSTENPTYHGPGRGAGNAVSTLLDAFTLTDESGFFEKAEELIRRCIHPLDDIASRNLLDIERRWSYTVFLCALGKYLDCKIQHGQLDQMYAYAQASLLQYARWMARHESPYLTRPQELQYPTETWSAQDMRKSDVFKWAAKHAQGDERVSFLERSDFFFRTSTQELLGAKTRTLTRPVVLLMSHGYMQAYFQEHPGEAAPIAGERHEFGQPEAFRPQRERAIRKLKVLALLGSCVILVVVTYYFLPL